MTVGTLVSIPVIFDTAKKCIFLVKLVRFLAKNKYIKIAQNRKKKYKMYFHIWVNPQVFILVAFTGDSPQKGGYFA